MKFHKLLQTTLFVVLAIVAISEAAPRPAIDENESNSSDLQETLHRVARDNADKKQNGKHSINPAKHSDVSKNKQKKNLQGKNKNKNNNKNGRRENIPQKSGNRADNRAKEMKRHESPSLDKKINFNNNQNKGSNVDMNNPNIKTPVIKNADEKKTNLQKETARGVSSDLIKNQQKPSVKLSPVKQVPVKSEVDETSEPQSQENAKEVYKTVDDVKQANNIEQIKQDIPRVKNDGEDTTNKLKGLPELLKISNLENPPSSLPNVINIPKDDTPNQQNNKIAPSLQDLLKQINRDNNDSPKGTNLQSSDLFKPLKTDESTSTTVKPISINVVSTEKPIGDVYASIKNNEYKTIGDVPNLDAFLKKALLSSSNTNLKSIDDKQIQKIIDSHSSVPLAGREEVKNFDLNKGLSVDGTLKIGTGSRVIAVEKTELQKLGILNEDGTSKIKL